MFRLVREHLVAKIAVVLLATLVLGFAVPTLLGAHLQEGELEEQNERSAGALAQGLAAAVRTAMLTGNGITARETIEDARGRITTARIRIYAPSGEEVFAPPTPPPAPSDVPGHVATVLESKKPGKAPDDARAIPIPNEERCQRCHAEGEMRAVLTIGTAGTQFDLGDTEAVSDALLEIASAGFEQIMTAEKEDMLDAYFEELAAGSHTFRRVAVVDNGGDVAFGAKELAPDKEALAEALKSKAAVGFAIDGGAGRIVPLPNAPQCHACHEAEDETRGAIVGDFASGEIDPRAALLEVADSSLRHVMLAGLGRLIARFLDSVPKTGTVTTLTLHDAEGRLYRDAMASPEPPQMVAQALAQADTKMRSGTDSEGRELYTFVEPLRNDPECQQCHGTDYDLRGAIEVILDTSASAQSRRMVLQTGFGFATGTILLTIVVLYIGLRLLVIRPVNEIGTVAEHVGAGRLDTKVIVRTSDEIGRLGERLNHMIMELRKKIELSKFVSQATVSSVDAADSAVQRRGERARVVVLFSDIRGFTAFSETVQPEEVVEMLNRLLDAQAAVVERWQGDIDKFVGDELMATFRGDDMECRAVRCAVEMVEAVVALNHELPDAASRMKVGVGVNVGEVVVGAMGARARMDFTVIGDAVNLGARLCSAAAGGQVIVSADVRNAVGLLDGVYFEPLHPIEVKGKREPIQPFAAHRARSS